MRIPTQFLLPSLLLLFLPSAQAQWQPLGNVGGVQTVSNGVELTVGEGHLRITALSPNVVRLRYAAHGSFPEDQSFAVLPNAFPESAKVDVKNANDATVVDTGTLQLRIEKSPHFASGSRCRSTSTTSDSEIKRGLSTIATLTSRCGTWTCSDGRSPPTRCTRRFRFFSACVTAVLTEFFWTIPTEAASILAKNLVMPTHSALRTAS